jgi:hypothetical protein
MVIIGEPQWHALPPVQPANVPVTMFRVVALALITYPSGRVEPRIFSGMSTSRHDYQGARDYATTVLRYASRGYIEMPHHRARPIIGFEWIARTDPRYRWGH